MTDDFADQFGGKDGRKFMIKNLKNLITTISDESMKKQGELLTETIDNWKKTENITYDQTDDITVFGMKI